MTWEFCVLAISLTAILCGSIQRATSLIVAKLDEIYTKGLEIRKITEDINNNISTLEMNFSGWRRSRPMHERKGYVFNEHTGDSWIIGEEDD